VPSTLESRFLAVQRLLAEILGHQHLGPETPGGQALVDGVTAQNYSLKTLARPHPVISP
jgi:hypothetical protein